MKKFYLLFAICLFSLVSYAQDTDEGGVKENVLEEQVGNNPITLNASLEIGSSNVANHFIATQNFSGSVYGIHADLGRFYKRWKNVSWNLSFDYLNSVKNSGSLENSAQTSSLGYSAVGLNYSSYYNWLFGKSFMIKVGGGIDLMYDMTEALKYRTNNPASMNLSAQLEASAGISYVFQFKKWMLGLSGNISVPFLGVINTDSKHETGMPTDGLMKKYDSHFKGTTFSNLQGVDYDLGVKFIMPRVALGVGVASDNRWWCVNDVQNYRKNIMFRVGLSFNLVSLKQTKTIHRYF